MNKYLVKNKMTVFINLLFSSLYSGAIGAIPLITKELLEASVNLTSKKLVLLVGMYFILIISAMLFQYISQWSEWKWSSCIEKELRYDLLDKILNGNSDDFNEYSKDEYLSMFSNDISTISEQYFTKKLDIIKSFIMVIIYAFYMFYFLNFWIATGIILCSLLSLFLPRLTGKTLSEKKIEYINSLGTQIESISDLLNGFSLINSQTKNNTMTHFNRSEIEVQKMEMKYGTYKAFTIVFNGFVMYLLDISAFAIAGLLLVFNKISLGTASAALSYVKTFIWPIRYLIDDINEMNASKKVIQKYLSILNRNTTNKPSIKFKNDIQYKDLTVRYSDFELKSFNYTFYKGNKYLIVGHSGSGKSTLLNCLVGIENNYNGKISIDGFDVKDLDLSVVISGIYKGANYIFHSSVINNITLFNSYRYECLNDYLERHPNNKINQLMAMEDASALSNGEKQMVALLRTYCLDTPLVILDEAFVNIDVEQRSYFMNMFLNDSKRTIIMVSHHINEELTNKMDEIICLNHGNLNNKKH